MSKKVIFRASLFSALAAVALVAAFAAFFSCEVGLGEAVDVETPKVQIDLSDFPVDDAVKGTKTISGVSSDDRGVESMTVTLLSVAADGTETKSGEWKVTGDGDGRGARLNDDGSWSLPIDTSQFGDGTYKIEVTGTDGTHTSAPATNTFKIDNTPPVFALNKPNSFELSDPAAYGREIKVNGEIADDHTIKEMKVYAYDGSGNPITLAQDTFSGFDTAGGTSVMIAKYFASESEAGYDANLQANYKALYGDTLDAYMKGDTSVSVKRFIHITLEDKAGNVSGSAYIKSALFDAVKPLYAGASGSLETADIKKVLNGSVAEADLGGAEKRRALLNLLAGLNAAGDGPHADAGKYFETNGDETRAGARNFAISLNPKENPMFEAPGFKFDPSVLVPESTKIYWAESASESSISIKVAAGLGGYAVKPETLRVILVKCDEDGNVYSASDKANYEKFEIEGTSIKDGQGNPVSGMTTPIDTGMYSVALPKMMAGTHYIITVEGQDTQGYDLAANNVYGFRVASNGKAPEVSLAEDKTYVNAAKFGATGGLDLTFPIADSTMTLLDNKETGENAPFHATVEVFGGHYAAAQCDPSTLLGAGDVNVNGKANAPVEYLYNSSQITQDQTNKSFYTTHVTVGFTPSSTVANYTVRITVSSKNATEPAKKVFVIWADNAAPVMEYSNTELTPVAPATVALVTEKSGYYSSEIDANGATVHSYTVSGKWSDVDGASAVALFYSASSDTFDFTLIDDATGLLKIDPVSGNAVAMPAGWAMMSDSEAPEATKKVGWSHEFVVEEGKGKQFCFFATDGVGNHTEIKKFDGITFDFSAPTVELVAPDPVEEYYTTGKVEFQFSASDSLEIADIDITAQKKAPGDADFGDAPAASVKIDDAVISKDKKSATKKITIDCKAANDAQWKITARGLDSAGRFTSANSAVVAQTVIDATKPVFGSYTVDGATFPFYVAGKNPSGLYYKDPTLKVKGKYTEAMSGGDTIYYYLWYQGKKKAGSQTEDADPPTNKAVTDPGAQLAEYESSTPGKAEFEISPSGFVEGECTLAMTIKDKAGNYSDIKTQTIQIDQSAPDFAAKWYIYESGEGLASGTVLSNGKYNMTLYGLISDTISGVKGLSFTVGGKAITAAVEYTAHKFTGAAYADFSGITDWADISSVADAKTVTAFKAVLPKAAIGAGGVVKALPVDMAGNEANPQLFTITVDNDSPSDIAIKNPATHLAARSYVEAGEDKSKTDTQIADATKPYAVNGDISIQGTASDNYTLGSVSMYWSLDSSATINTSRATNPDTLIDTKTGSPYSWVFGGADNTAKIVMSQNNAGGNANALKMIDGTLFTGTAKDVYIKVQAKDTAGNESVNVYKYSINPDLDRPVITLSDIDLTDLAAGTASQASLGLSKMTGTISEDDGTKKFEYSTDGTTWTEVPVTNSSWEITFAADGQKDISFRVTDTAGGVFTSGAAQTGAIDYLSPKISDKDGHTLGVKANQATKLALLVDTTPPAISGAKYFEYATFTDGASATYAAFKGLFAAGYSATGAAVGSSNDLGTVGGVRDRIKISVSATDANGIKGVVARVKDKNGLYLKADGSAVPTASGKTGAAEYTGSNGGAGDTYTIEVLNPAQSGGSATSLIEKLSSGGYTLEVTATDGAGTDGTAAYTFTVDNDPPAARVTQPAVSVESSPEAGGVEVSGSVTGNQHSIYYALSAGAATASAPAPAKGTAPADGDFKKMDSSATWSMMFDGDTDPSKVGTHGGKLEDLVVTLGCLSKNSAGSWETINATNKTDSKVTQVWFWARAVDNLGNVEDTPYLLYFDPNGDRPKIDFGSPDQGAVLGGKTGMYGNVEDTLGAHPGVDSAWIQIISHDHNDSAGARLVYDESGQTQNIFTFTKDDLDYMAGAQDKAGNPVYEIYNMKTYTQGGTNARYTGSKTSPGSLASGSVAADYAALVTVKKPGATNTTWSMDINVNEEFNPTNSSGPGGSANDNLVGMRIFAKDKDGKIGIEQTRYVKFSKDAPVIKDIYLQSIDDADVLQTYKSGMFVKGKWKLMATITSGSGVASVKIDGSAVSYTGDSDKKNCALEYDLGLPATGVGRTRFQIVAMDATGKGGGAAADSHTTTLNIDIRYDNEKPLLAPTTDSKYSIEPEVRQSDSFYTFSSKVSEEAVGASNQSGFHSVAAYFLRRSSTGVPSIYNLLRAQGSGATANKMDVSGAKTDAKNASAGDIVYDSGLYWKKLAISRPVAGTSTGEFTVTGLTADVHVNSLVKIGGLLYRITAINGTSITLDGVPSSKGSYSYGLFANAFVIDNLVQEGRSGNLEADGYCSAPTNDDGDRMIEGVKQTGDSWRWEASVCSKNIPDGPVEIHYVAFDAAGNYSIGVAGNLAKAAYSTAQHSESPDVYFFDESVPVFVSNNGPRISRVMLATDLSGDGKYDYEQGTIVNWAKDPEKLTANGAEFGEFSFYSALSGERDADSMAQSEALIKGREFVVKNSLLLVPEFVGGNVPSGGSIKYTYKVSPTTEKGGSPSASNRPTAEGATVTKGTGASLKSLQSYSALSTKLSGAGVEGDLFNTTGGADDSKATATGQRSPERDDAGNAVTVKSHGALELTKSELTTYESWKGDDKFAQYFAFTFWDATTDTVQGQNSCHALLKLPLIIDVVDDTNPSVEIEPFYWDSWESSSTAVDGDNQPLGHIDLEADLNNGNGAVKPEVAGKVILRGTAYDNTRLKEIWVKDPDGGSGYKIATWLNNVWVPVTSGLPAHWSDPQADGDRPTQAGHRATWSVAIDMTKYGVATDKTVIAYAKDDAATANVSSKNAAEQTAKFNTATKKHSDVLTSTYKMDFVPYIKGVEGATRSRLGRYSARKGDTLTIECMNVKAGDKPTVTFYKTASGGGQATSGGVTATGVTMSGDGKIKVVAPENSRFVEVTVSGKTTQNNKNNNKKGYNVTKGNYSKGDQANGDDYWTDDCYISVWNTDTNFPGSVNPHSGVIKKVRASDTPLKGGAIGIKEKGSMIEINKSGNVIDSYVSFIASDDMRPYLYAGTDKFMAMTPASDLAMFNNLVDEADCIVVGGLPYYVIQTNYVGNVNSNVWGPGLLLAREGFEYSRDGYERTDTLSTQNLNWIIERQGSNNSAMGRNSSDGFDSVLYQFKNVRMAGWHNSSPTSSEKCEYYSGSFHTQTDYIYVTYYDSYARCLKYAAFRSGRTVGGDDRISNVKNTASNLQWGGGNAGDHELVAEARAAASADTMKNGATVVAGHDTTTNNPTSFTEIAGQWSDIVLDATGTRPIPVIVYYNETAGTLEVARGKATFPKSSGNMTTKTGEDAWYKTKGINPSGSGDFGRYVSAAVDTHGNLHVAAQDADKAKLWYLYLTKNGNNYTVSQAVAVDGSSGAGRWTDIELTNPGGADLAAIKPVISYINTSYLGTTKGIKVAYIDSVETTGSRRGRPHFDAMTDPARYSAGDQRTSVMGDVKEVKGGSAKAMIGVGFNSDMLALDFLRGE